MDEGIGGRTIPFDDDFGTCSSDAISASTCKRCAFRSAIRWRASSSSMTLDVTIQVDDPGAFNMPWSVRQCARQQCERDCEAQHPHGHFFPGSPSQAARAAFSLAG
jgi:hypothetical protein